MDQDIQTAETPIRLRHVIWALKRHIPVILAGLIFGILLSYLFSIIVPPKYRATAQLLFDPAAEQLTKPDPSLVPTIQSLKALERAVALIQSPATLKQVAAEFSATQNQTQPTTSLQQIVSTKDLDKDQRLRRVISQLQKDLSVRTDAADQIIFIDYQSKSPKEASFIANLIAQTFIEDRTAKRKEAVSQATLWLDEQTIQIKEKLLAIDKKLQDYKAIHKIESDGTSSVYDSELTRLREQLAQVESKLSEAESAYKTLQSYAGERTNYAKLAESLDGVAMEKLRASLADAEGELAAAKTKFGSHHPEVQRKLAQVEVIRHEIEAAARRKLVTAQSELDSLRTRQQDLSREIAGAEARIKELRTSEVQFRELLREKEAIKTAYDSTLIRLTQVGPLLTLASSEFQVIFEAAVPDRPKLNPILIWIAGGLAGLSLGVGLSLLLEFFNDRLVHLDDEEARIPVKVIARLPAISEKELAVTGSNIANGSFRGTHSFTKYSPNSLFTNCLLSANLALADADAASAAKILMITSPTQGNGKSVVTSNLACLSALLGKKTLLIDLDARKEMWGTTPAGGEGSSGLREFLDQAKLSQVLSATTEMEDFDVIRQRPAEGPVWLRFFQPQLRELLEYAQRNYDQVWIDSPPVQMFPDALILAKRVDGVIIIAEWSKTSSKQLTYAQDKIIQSGGKVLGVIVNKVKIDSLICETMANYKNYRANGEKRQFFALAS